MRKLKLPIIFSPIPYFTGIIVVLYRVYKKHKFALIATSFLA